MEISWLIELASFKTCYHLLNNGYVKMLANKQLHIFCFLNCQNKHNTTDLCLPIISDHNYEIIIYTSANKCGRSINIQIILISMAYETW